MHSRLSNSSLTLATILLVTLGVAHADPSADKEAAQAAFARAEAAMMFGLPPALPAPRPRTPAAEAG